MKKRTDTKVELEDKLTQTDTHTHKWTNRQEYIGYRDTDKQTNAHTYTQNDKHANRQINIQTHK